MSKNTRFNNIEGLFNVTKNLTADNEEKNEIQHFWNETAPSWTRSTLLNDRAKQLMKAKVNVDMDSVLCLGRILQQVMQLNNGEAKWPED